MNFRQIIKSTEFSKKEKRKFYHWVVEQLVVNVEEYRNGVSVYVGGKYRWLIPVIAFVITDWPEGQSMSLTKAGAVSSKRNCRVCTKPTKLFDITEDGGLGTHRIMKETMQRVAYFTCYNNHNAKEIANEERENCVYMCSNGFWKGVLYTDRFGHHGMFPFDYLHTVCHGTADILLHVLLAYCKKYKTLDGILLFVRCCCLIITPQLL